MSTPPKPPAPNLSLSLATKRITNTLTGVTRPPHFANSVNEFRGFCTALSEFLNCYDELQNHLRFIELSIDSKLSSHNVDIVDSTSTNPSRSVVTHLLETDCNRTVTGFTEVVASEKIPNESPSESGSGYQRSHAVATTTEGTVVSCNSDGIDGLEMHEGVDESMNREGIDVSEENVGMDVSRNCIEIDELKEHAETGRWKKVEESDDLKKFEEAVAETSCVETITAVAEAIVSVQNLEETDILKKPEEINILKKPEDIDILNKPEETDVLNKPEESDILRKFEQTAICKNPEEIDKNPEEIDTVKKHEETGMCNQPEETNVLKKPKVTEYSKKSIVSVLEILSQNMCYQEIPEVIDMMVKGNLDIEAVDIAYTFGLEDKCHPPHILKTCMHNLVEDIENGSSFQTAKKQQLCNLKAVKQCLESHNVDPSMLLPDFKINEKIQNLEKEINQGELTQKRKSLDSLIHHEAKRLCFNHENMPRQHKPVDHHGMSAYNQSTQSSTHCFDFDRYHLNSYMNDYTDSMALTNTINVSKKAVEIDTLKNPEVYVSNKAVEIDVLKKREEIDVSNDHEEIDVFKNRKEVDVLTKHAETDTWNKPKEINTLKKPEETVAETSCVETLTAVPETIVLERNPNRMATNCEQSHENVRTPECLDEAVVSKKAVEIDVSKKAVEIDVSKKREEIDVSDNHEEIVALKNLKEVDVLMKHAETDTWNKPKKIDTLKKPEETVAETSCVETLTAVPEAIVLEQNPNRMATNCEQSHDNVRTPECLDEADVPKNPEEFNVARKPKGAKTSKQSVISVLEALCQDMCSKEMRKHVTKHYSEMSKLHKEIGKALKLAKDPAKLVLNSISRFFVQERSSFCKDSSRSAARLATVLLLECFLMISSDGIEIAKREKIHAARAADDWRTRMRKDGGLRQADEVDAQGLLLFISGFGIHDDVFKLQDIVDLIRASNMKRISTALRCSVFLKPKIPEVIDLMVKNNLEIEAADIAFTFGLEDTRHPQKILRSYLHNLVNNTRNGSSFQTLEAIKQQILDLKFVKQYLESRDTDSSMLREFKVTKRIQNLEKEIKRGEVTQKRKPLETYVSKKAVEIDVSKNREEIDTLKKREETVTETSERSVISELESLCRNMCSSRMRSHVAKHYSEMRTLHKEIEKAFKLAKDPAKLVLESIGRFFVQGRKMFCSDSYQIVVRQATVLILECFVMISGDGIKIAKREKENAAQTAVDWRERMIKEGGLRQVDEIDARGLLLLISGFGIKDRVFKIRDIMNLIRASNVKGISTALRRSVFLIPKVPEVIDLMMKNNLEIEAVDIAYTFRLEGKHHPWKILRTYLHNLVKDIQKSFSLRTLEAMKQQLYDLKSVKQCLESHNVDPSILLPEYKLNDMIEYLVREVEVERSMTLKRRSLENPSHQEAKHARFDHDSMPRHHNPVANHHGMSPYNWSTQLTTHYLDRNHPNSYISNHSENIDRSVLSGPANVFPTSYDQMLHRADVLAYGRHYSRHDQTYGSQPYHDYRVLGPQEPLLDVPHSGGFPGRRPPPEPVLSYVEIPPSGGFREGRPPPEPFHEFEDHPASGGFSRRRVSFADLYSFGDRL